MLIISITALVLAAIAFGLSLGNSSRIDSHERLHATQQIIRSSIERCTQSQFKHLQNWIMSVENELKKRQEENNG